MLLRKSLLLIVLLFLIPGALYADYLEVSRSAIIKAAPEKGAATIARVSAGEYLALIDASPTNGYYHVKTINDQYQGWIYRTLVRGYRGEPPISPAESKAVVSNISLVGDPEAVLTGQQQAYASRHLALGKPIAVYERVREGYVLAQDARLKIPLWVQYKLTREDLADGVARKDDFRPDTSIPKGARSELSDYTSSGFDRGHMAPAADMKRNQSTMSECFLLSNMAPQIGVGFNRDIWQHLEEAIRNWTMQKDSLTIIMEPIFTVSQGEVSYKVIGKDNVAVPNAFYKIVVHQDQNRVEALAFIIPNKDLRGHELKEYLVSIDEIESLTGLDFLSALPDSIENSIEAAKAQDIW